MRQVSFLKTLNGTVKTALHLDVVPFLCSSRDVDIRKDNSDRIKWVDARI